MIKLYGPDHMMTPPLIDVMNITKRSVPIAMFVGAKDSLAVKEDCEYLKETLGPETVVHYTLLKNFDHSSFNVYKEEDIGFTNQIMDLIKERNPLPVKNTNENGLEGDDL